VEQARNRCVCLNFLSFFSSLLLCSPSVFPSTLKPVFVCACVLCGLDLEARGGGADRKGRTGTESSCETDLGRETLSLFCGRVLETLPSRLFVSISSEATVDALISDLSKLGRPLSGLLFWLLDSFSADRTMLALWFCS
jgi:hypothetical protein